MTNERATSGTTSRTNLDLHRHCLRKAQQAEAAATQRKDQIRVREARDLHLKFESQPGFWRGRDFMGELDDKVGRAASNDPIWKRHVADNQWFIAQATMYGIAALVDAQVGRG